MRPNLVGNPADLRGTDEVNHWFDLNVFHRRARRSAMWDATPCASFWQWDMGVNKNFRIRESMALQFRSEFFNILNHTNLGPYVDQNISDPTAFGTIKQSYPARQIQFALKLLW